MKRSYQHRVVLHFDVDAFYVACERELRPELRNKPLGVSQYNPYGDLRDMSIEDPSRLVIQPSESSSSLLPVVPHALDVVNSTETKEDEGLSNDQQKTEEDGRRDSSEKSSPKKRPPPPTSSNIDSVTNKNDSMVAPAPAITATATTITANNNGSLIAVSYEARAHNVKRNDRGRDAVKKCPSLYVIQVPVKHGKADLTIYRKASQRVMKQMVNGMIQASHELYDRIVAGGSKGTTKNSEQDDVEEARTPNNNQNDKNENRGKRNRPKDLSQIKVEKASVDEVYVEISSPVNALLQALDDCSINKKEGIFQSIIGEPHALQTTVGGLETSEAGLANNALSKDELRRGSCLQVLDQPSMDTGSLSWWNRPSNEWWSIDNDGDERALAIGAALCGRTRMLMSQSFEGVYTLSGGISTNKVMAKLASGLKKPNRQTLINPNDMQTVQTLFHPLPIGRLRGLGGKFGDHVERVLNVSTVGELARVPKSIMLHHFSEEQTDLLQRMAQGICEEEVEDRTKSKSIGAGKTFRNHLSVRVDDFDNLKKWLVELASEVDERLEMDFDDHSRHASLLTVHLIINTNHGISMKGSSSMSKSTPLSYGSGVKEDHGDMAFKLAKELLSSIHKTTPDGKTRTVNGMSVSASNFVPLAKGKQSIMESFQKVASASTTKKEGIAHHGDGDKVSVLPGDRVGVHNSTSSATQLSNKNKKQRIMGQVAGITTVHSFLVPSAQLKPPGTTKKATTNVNNTSLGLTGNTASVPVSSSSNNDEVVIVDDDEEDGGYLPSSTTTTMKPSVVATSDTNPTTTTIISTPVDKDMEYAKRLQESYDKENELWSRLEQRRRSSAGVSTTKNKISKKKQSQESSKSTIRSFFRRKTS